LENLSSREKETAAHHSIVFLQSIGKKKPLLFETGFLLIKGFVEQIAKNPFFNGFRGLH